MTEKAEPAVVEPPSGVRSSVAAEAALTDQVSVSVREPFPVSVTVTVLLPEVYRVTPLVKVCELELKV